MTDKITLATTKNEYSDNAVVRSYVDDVDEIGLWQSEKIIFEKYISINSNILDIGCGAGRTTFGLHKIGYPKLTGFDLSEAMINACKIRAMTESANIEFINGNACEMPFESQIFDAIIFSFNGLMTIPTKVLRGAAFAEIARVLKAGGIFIFTTHDMKNEQFLEYWKEEKIKWHKGEQDKRLNEYGDLIFTDQKSNVNIEAFVHVPEYAEIVEETAKVRLEIIHSVVRSKLCEENETTQKCSGDCKFWVCRKKPTDT